MEKVDSAFLESLPKNVMCILDRVSKEKGSNRDKRLVLLRFFDDSLFSDRLNPPPEQTHEQSTTAIIVLFPSFSRRRAYKLLYSALREVGAVHGEKVTWPDEIVELIRFLWADPEAEMGAYDRQHATTCKMTLNYFLSLPWPRCVCGSDSD